MKVHNIEGRQIVVGNKSPEPSIRRELSNLILEKYGRGEYTQQDVREIITFSLNFYLLKFESLCHSEKSFYFYQGVFSLHEDAIELAMKYKNRDISPEITGGYLAEYRRILKFIMEVGCEVPILKKGAYKPDSRNQTQKLNTLLFLGHMALSCVSVYAEQSMVEDVGEVLFDDDDLYVFTRRHHYNEVFEHFIESNSDYHSGTVVDHNGISDLIKALEISFGFEFSNVKDLIHTIREQLGKDYEGVNCEAFPENLEHFFHIPYEIGQQFFDGLTLSKDNKMSLFDLICKPYNLNRYLYRPLIVWNVDGHDYVFYGANAWTESFIQLATNAIPWGKAPNEWMKNKIFKRLVHEKENQHDKWLDDAVEEIIKNGNYPYDRNVKKLYSKGSWINFDIKDLGEIDFLIVAHNIKKIFVADCKHLLSRYDATNQRNDYNSFVHPVKGYNVKISNKLTWFRNNINFLSDHFSYRTGVDVDITKYEINGIFIINTPTLYMYNSEFRIYTLGQLNDVLAGAFKDPIIKAKIATGETIEVSYPYLTITK